MKEIVEICRQSYKRCHHNPEFLDRFYRFLLDSSEEIREKFGNTDFKRQKKALSLSLHMILLSSSGADAADVYLDFIAERHNRGNLDIKPKLYSLWLAALLNAVRESDPEYDSEIENAWRLTMQDGIDYMIGKY